jgi:hypothetical protein
LPRASYIVEPVGAHWNVRAQGEAFGPNDGRVVGPYRSQDSAIAAAMKAGRLAEAKGFDVQVRVMPAPADEFGALPRASER